MDTSQLERLSDTSWRIPPHGQMRVPAIIFAQESLIEDMDQKVYEQATNVASLYGSRIDELGSISAAAKSMKLAYRNAWLWVEAMNNLAPTPLVAKSAGGSAGGYARLTEEGRRIVAEYKEKRARFQELLRKIK